MIENMKVRRFKEEDAQEVRNLIVRNFLEVNSKDYGISAMEKLAKAYNAEKVLNVASYAHMYVFEFDGKIIGTGSISSFWGSETESILLSIFVLPEFHGKGVGMKRAEQFLGVSLVSEKEVILIVARSEQKNSIMNSIMEKAGVTSKAGTIVFSLPVTSTAGLRSIEDI